jgi:hypothetical protein
MARGKKTGGRRPGSRNKATIERALRAERAAADIPLNGRRLATEQLDAYMQIFADTAAHFREAGDLDQFREWAALAIEAAKALAPFQSPRYSTVAVAASTITKIEIVGGMSDKEFPAVAAELPADLSPGMIVEADIRGDIDPDDVAEPEPTLPAGPAAG